MIRIASPKLLVLALLLSTSHGAQAADYSLTSGSPPAELAERGMFSERPAAKWQEGLVSGNGTMGVLVFGEPYEERIVFNHERLYEPLLDEPCPVPDLAPALPEVRRLMLAGKYKEAYQYSYDYAVEQGFPGIQWTDPYHPAFAMLIKQPATDEVTEYWRSTDFPTGDVTVHWRDAGGEWLRRAFVSRTHNVVVQQLTPLSGQTIQCSIALANQDKRAADKRTDKKGGGYRDPDISAEEGWLSYRCKYARSQRGYEAVVRVIVQGGSQKAVDGRIEIRDADEVVLLSRIHSLADFGESQLLPACRELLAIEPDYTVLLAQHGAIHGDICGRVKFNLGADSESRRLSSEALLAAQKEQPDTIQLALLEKMFNMGRYAFVSASGEWPPNLMGIWCGDWRPAWSGDFTLDANVNLQVSAANIGDMIEGTQSYTNLIDGIVPDWRVNAEKLFGCRGVLAGTRTDGRHNLHTHFSEGFPGHFWIAGAEWLVLPMFEYYQVSGDREYLETMLVPLLKEIALFYEDFLTETDENGKFVFVPSYSPENRPANTNCPAAINAAMDLACAKEALTYLIDSCRELEIETENLAKWETMREKIPPYLVNDDGAFKEWAHPDLDDNYDHRHVSHLYPLWPGHEISPEETPELFQAAKTAARLRGRGNGSAHGLAHMALIGTRLKDAKLVSGNLLFMLKNDYILPSLFTYHNPNRIYNSDMLCSLPAVVMEMLVYSRPGTVELLPALGTQLSRGRVEGILCRGQIRVAELKWDLPAKTVSATLVSSIGQEVTLRLRRGMKEVRVAQGDKKDVIPLEDSDSTSLSLTAKVPTELEITLP